MKRVKFNKHTMITAATALLTMASVGATPAVYAADAASSNANSEIVSAKAEPDSYSKDSLQKLVAVVESSAFQAKIKQDDNTNDTTGLSSALKAAKAAVDSDSGVQITNTGKSLHRFAVKIDSRAKRDLGDALDLAQKNLDKGNVKKAYDNGLNVKDNLGADISLINDATSAITGALKEVGLDMTKPASGKPNSGAGSSSLSSSSSETNDNQGSASDSKSSSDDSKSDSTLPNKPMTGGTGHENSYDQGSTSGSDSALIKSPEQASYQNQLDQNIHTAESQDMQRKATLATKDSQDDLDQAIEYAKGYVDSKDSKAQEQANNTLLKAMNRINNEAKEPLKLLDGEMKTFSKSNGFKKLDDSVQQDFDNQMQKIETVLANGNATYGDIIAAQEGGNNILQATLTSSDKTLLKSAINEANSLAAGDLAKKASKDSLSSLNTQIALARQILDDKNASQSNVDQAAQSLRTAETQFLTTLANSSAAKDKNMESSNEDTALTTGTSGNKKVTRSSALKALGQAIKNAKQFKHTSAYKHADAGDQVAFDSVLDKAELLYDDPSDASSAEIQKKADELNRDLKILGGNKSNSTKQLSTGSNSGGSSDGVMTGGTGRGGTSNISRASALRALKQAINKAVAIKGRNDYKSFDGSQRQELSYALQHAQSVYNKGDSEPVSVIVAATNRLNNAMSPFTSSSDDTNSGSSDGEMAGGTNNGGNPDANGGSNPDAGSNNSDGTSANTGTTASQKSRGALPQTGHFIIQHAKAIMAAIGVTMAGLVGFLYKNNKDKDEAEKDTAKGKQI